MFIPQMSISRKKYSNSRKFDRVMQKQKEGKRVFRRWFCLLYDFCLGPNYYLKFPPNHITRKCRARIIRVLGINT